MVAEKEKFVVRRPIQEDFEAIVRMAREAWEEGGLTTWNEEKARAFIQFSILQPPDPSGDPVPEMIAGVIGPKGSPTAMCMILRGQFYYSRESLLEECLVYVKPEFRKSGRAKALLHFMKGVAELLKRPLLIGIISNKDTQRKIALYNRIFGEPTGAYYFWCPPSYNKQPGWL
jgi:GNAT superfamily N-acetyltransferase